MRARRELTYDGKESRENRQRNKDQMLNSN
jgi:hypothetical protein